MLGFAHSTGEFAMRWTFAGSLAVLLALLAPEAQADKLGPPSLREMQAPHSVVGDTCGQGGDKRTYSDTEYAYAIAKGKAALKAAKGNTAQTAAINRNLKNIDDCKKEGAFTPPPPEVFSCGELIYQYQSFMSKTRGAGAVKQAKAKFAKSFAPCLKKALSECVDPNDTKQFNEAVSLLEMAESLGFFSTIKFDKSTSYKYSAAVPMPGGAGRLSFCTDTDFECHKGGITCQNKLDTLNRLVTFR